MKFSMLSVFFILCCLGMAVQARLAGECAMLCNDLRLDVLNMEICREARKTLPRPKVGDFCMNAMEQGFSDACVALCMDQEPVARVAQTCRSAAIEMPRPTVRKWCEHGYNKAFSKTLKDLKDHFVGDVGGQYSNVAEAVTANSISTDPHAHQHEEEVVKSLEADGQDALREKGSGMYRGEEEAKPRVVLTTIPITLDDQVTKELTLYEGQSPEEAVVGFCKEAMGEDGEVATCIRQLLGVVIEKMNNL